MLIVTSLVVVTGESVVMLAAMFERFLDRYPFPDGRADELWDAGPLLSVAGYADLARRAAGLPLCGGLLRLAGAREGRLASKSRWTSPARQVCY